MWGGECVCVWCWSVSVGSVWGCVVCVCVWCWSVSVGSVGGCGVRGVGVVLECMCECGVGVCGWGCLRKNCEIFYKQRLPFFKF